MPENNQYKTLPLKEYIEAVKQNDPNFDKVVTTDEDRNTAFREKYGEYAANREWWADAYNRNIEGGRVGDIINTVASKAGINPRFLYGNAMEEGFWNALHGNKVGANVGEDYRYDGMALLGLDQFGAMADTFKKKGYIPADFDYLPTEGTNNKGDKTASAHFKSPTDALTAMTAFLKNNQDEVKSYLKKKGLNLSQDAQDFFTMAAYNGGMGNAGKMLDFYHSKGLLKDDKFLKEDLRNQPYGEIYRNVRRRMDASRAIESEGLSYDKKPWTGSLEAVKEKAGEYEVLIPRSKEIPFKVVLAGNKKKIVPRDADLSSVDVAKLPDLNIYDYEANLKP